MSQVPRGESKGKSLVLRIVGGCWLLVAREGVAMHWKLLDDGSASIAVKLLACILSHTFSLQTPSTNSSRFSERNNLTKQ
mmetsp:Transcript_33153/g.97816  ORF Transcript_33153/g.97816 Transcript_33153/m.97816 type:complete len:80 (+) Transcript_33153:183-422(+)